MRIAVDAMGGDNAPGEIVRGVLDALNDADITCELILVGHKDRINEIIGDHRDHSGRLSIVHAEQVIEMHESPVLAVKKKRHSSLSVALNLVKEGKADAVVSAGNTGAVLVASTLKLRTIKNIERPAIGLVFPTAAGFFVMLDGGANSDCRPKHLQQFGIMGAVLAQRYHNIENPRVGLLNIGHEEGKGNELVKESYGLLKESHVNFIGNVEGKDAFCGNVDVVVCDGFVGNIVLKFSESLAMALIGMLKNAVMQNIFTKLGALLLKPALKQVLAKTRSAEYGAAPLLGLNGVCLKAHGSSSAEAIKNAIKNAEHYVRNDINGHIAKAVAELEH